MKVHPPTFLLAALLVAGPAGCSDSTSSGPTAAEKREAKIQTALDKLSMEDRTLAQEQKYCAVETEHRLGSMGKPVKVMVKGKPVFLCCKGCEERALAEPAKTLAAVERLKAKNASAEK
jgi:hypothetical protein